jgi:anti-anti-sigma factor
MAEPATLTIQREMRAESVRITPAGELDLATVPQLEREVEEVLAQGVRELVIDLGGLTFMDSSALRLFLMLSQRAPGEGFTLSLVNPAEQVRSVLQITGAEQSLPLSEESGGGAPSGR